MNKKRRFFFHFRKQTGMLTLRWGGKCIPVKDIECKVPVETKWNNRQPRVVLRGYATEVLFEGDKATII